MRVRGRFWLGLWLVFFLGVSLVVVARQRAALATADRLRRLREERLALEARGAELERRIQAGASRAVLVPRAENRLQLHLPSDSEYVFLKLRSPAGAPF